MQAFSFMNQKGGVGKTTTTMNVGAALARGGYRVLLVDMDPQMNLSGGFGIGPKKDGSVIDFLVNDSEPLILEIYENLHVLPGSDSMTRFDKYVLESPVHSLEPARVLSKRIEEAGFSGQYDFILFDSPPKLDLITTNILAYLDWLFIPIMSEEWSVGGAEKTIENATLVRKSVNPELTIGGLFFVRYDPRAILYRSYKESLANKYNNLVLEYFTRENVSLRECLFKRKDIFDYAPQSNGAQDYFNLTNELLFVMRQKPLEPFSEFLKKAPLVNV